MAFAAVSRGLYELEIGTRKSDEELKQQIAQQYRVSTKTLDRWWALLDLPPTAPAPTAIPAPPPPDPA